MAAKKKKVTKKKSPRKRATKRKATKKRATKKNEGAKKGTRKSEGKPAMPKHTVLTFRLRWRLTQAQIRELQCQHSTKMKRVSEATKEYHTLLRNALSRRVEIEAALRSLTFLRKNAHITFSAIFPRAPGTRSGLRTITVSASMAPRGSIDRREQEIRMKKAIVGAIDPKAPHNDSPPRGAIR